MATAPPATTMDHQALDGAGLRRGIGLSVDEIDRRKAWLGLDDGDTDRLRHIDNLVGAHVGTMVDGLVDDLVPAGDGEGAISQHDRSLLRDYFAGLTCTRGFDDDHLDKRLAMIEQLQGRTGRELSWYLAAYLAYLQRVSARLREEPGEQDVMQELQRTLAKAMCLDLSLVIDAYLFERDRTIRSQQRELEELSTPVLQLRDGLLITPIIGMLDSRRARQLTEQLLHAIRQRRARVVVLDVTGVAAVDSRVANHLIQTVDAARLMGATAIITGVSPEVAQTLVGLGVDVGNVITVADLQGGIDEADRLLGLRVVRVSEVPSERHPS